MESLPDSIAVKPIGVVSASRREPTDDAWGAESTITLDALQFGPEALAGLASFSHVEVLYWFHRVPDEEVERGARHPRGRTDWEKVGIFAQRGKGRPNRLGLSCCRVVKVEGLVLTVRDLDAIDGTPVVDLKPYLAEFGPRGETRQPAWSREIMSQYFVPEP